MVSFSHLAFAALVSSIVVFSQWTLAGVHGTDDRILVANHSDARITHLAQSVAAMIPASSFPELQHLLSISLAERKGFCANEPHVQHPTIATCSGVLVEKDLLLTTYHCVPTPEACKENRWIFNYTQSSQQISLESSYSCKEFVRGDRNLLTLQDYTLIRLDRPVEGATPVKIRTAGKIKDQDSVFMLGHPYGLPMMKAQSSRIVDNKSPHMFTTDLDAFAGNSGSPVFNSRTFELEGIFVRGGTDAIGDLDTEDICKRWYRCDIGKDEGCHTEDVTRIRSIPIR